MIFSGRTREPVVRGLTRPHSARLHRGQLWVDNSGYGEVGVCRDGALPTPSRDCPAGRAGSASHGGLAFVGTSRVLPRFHHTRPGLDPARCVCGVHAVDVKHAARCSGACVWPSGNQIFAIEPVPGRFDDRAAPHRRRADARPRPRGRCSTASSRDAGEDAR